MNKTLILFLVICIISVHAFVKRDAPNGDVLKTDDLLKTIQDTFTNLAKQGKEGALQFAENLNKMIDGLKPTEAPKGN